MSIMYYFVEFQLLKISVNIILHTGTNEQIDVTEIVDVNKSTNGTGCLRTIQTTIARVSSWIGSYFPLVAFVDAVQ